jgi:hypothetical protein
MQLSDVDGADAHAVGPELFGGARKVGTDESGGAQSKRVGRERLAVIDLNGSETCEWRRVDPGGVEEKKVGRDEGNAGLRCRQWRTGTARSL